MNKLNLLKLLLLFLAICEILIVTRFQKFAGPFNTPVYLFLVSIAIAILYYAISKIKNSRPIEDAAHKWKKTLKIVSISVFMILSLTLYNQLSDIIQSNPIKSNQVTQSDIIPQTQILVDRFTDGEFPYQIIPFHGYELYPTYLPMQWLPYVLCEWMDLDYRWLAAFLLWIASFIYFIKYFRRKEWTVFQPVIITWPLFVWLAFLFHDETQFAYTLESLIASYYLLMTLVLNSKNKILVGLMFSLCLLSRYSIILWVPFYFIQKLVRKEFKTVYVTGAVIVISFIVIYWIPFMRHDPSIFIQGYEYHTGAAIKEWQHAENTARPVHIFNGLGFAASGYKYLPFDSIEDKLLAWKKIHLAVTVGTVLILSSIYFFRRRKFLGGPYLLMSIKIYMMVFYQFIQIPYSYLFLVPIIITSVLLSEAFTTERSKAKPVQLN